MRFEITEVAVRNPKNLWLRTTPAAPHSEVCIPRSQSLCSHGDGSGHREAQPVPDPTYRAEVVAFRPLRDCRHRDAVRQSLAQVNGSLSPSKTSMATVTSAGHIPRLVLIPGTLMTLCTTRMRHMMPTRESCRQPKVP